MNPRRLSWLALIVSASLAAFVAISLGPSLFFAIPWPVRKGFGWAGFGLITVALGRRLLRGPAFSPPARVEEPQGWLARLGPALAGLLAAGLLGVPLLRHPENLGFDDWDLFLGKYEAARRTVADYGQFPWWDPWTRGGFPLAGNPQCGVWGVAMPLCLAFGTSVGLRLATLACSWLAFEGARRLARLWRFEPVAAGFAGFGVIHGFEPLMGYNRRAPTARAYPGNPGYVAEAWTDRGPAEVVSWSPNRIEVRARPGEEVSINQNPGSWWVVNGARPFEDARCAEMLRPFRVRADVDGRLILQIEPKGLTLGLWLHALGAALAAVGWAISRSFRPRPVKSGSDLCR